MLAIIRYFSANVNKNGIIDKVMREFKLTKSRLARLAVAMLLLLAAVFLTANQYKSTHFKDSQIDEIIFYFTNGLAGGKSDNIWEAVFKNIPLALIAFTVMSLPVIDKAWSYSHRLTNRLRNKLKKPEKPARRAIRLRYKFAYALVAFVLSFTLLLQSFGVPAYAYALMQSTKLYEEYYVNPKTAKLTFPDKKRNLIYIFMESMENTIASKNNGGQSEKSIIPELEELALDNTSFSNKFSGLGGAMSANGTAFTVGGMAAQSAGVPLKENIFGQDHNSMGMLNNFLPGAYTLGDILKQQGYNQTFIMGSESSFGGRDKLLTQHGSYDIQDYNYAKQHGQIAEDYKVWWGYEDKKLFQFAREEASRLASSDKPFNLQLLTADTHFTDGYLDETCAKTFANQYDNVHACSSKQVAEFVKWVQSQPFYENTTIVMSGDHLGMQTSYYDEKISEPNYQRTIYNAFINPATAAEKTHNRLMTTFDMYPSTLAALGVRIDGERLGLGTNLFANKQTLVEQLGGIDQLNSELSKRSNYYEKKIFSKSSRQN